MYLTPPTDAELQAWGLTRDDVAEEETVEIWPDCWEAVRLFTSLRTQWRVGFNGPIGLDYGVLPTIFRLEGIPRGHWPQLFEDMREMEDEALKTMREA